MSTEGFEGDDWMRPAASRETKTRNARDNETRIRDHRPKRENPPTFPENQFDEFEVRQGIGVGSHGWVFDAIDLANGRSVALKILADPGCDAALRAKTGFRRMSKLRHRGLMRLYRVTQDEHWVGLALEKIEGENLSNLMSHWKRLSLSQACDRLIEMIQQVSSGLAWMHARRLIHRDIKPSNLMWSESDNRFVLIDFDLVGMYDPEVDPTGFRDYLVWTPRYVAPEVLFRQSYGPASDVFSLGMVVLEALRVFSSAHRRSESGTLPEGGTASKLHRDQANMDRDQELIESALAGLSSEIPSLLTDALAEMLSPDAADRPMAMSLARLGMPPDRVSRVSVGTTELDRVRASVLETRQSELKTISNWAHLVFAGQIQRLHIEGPSGIGKSTLLDIAVEMLNRQAWAQVFVARCQRREQRPLAAFSQIADEIVHRFRRADREPMVVDLVTESILTRVLPGFAAAIRGDASLPGLVTSSSRPGGLEAAQKVCEQMRRLGPVILIVDDLQWADQDTLNVLDHLQTASLQRVGGVALEGLGLITISRPDGDRQNIPPHVCLNLGPLTREMTADVLMRQTETMGLRLTPEQMVELIDDVHGQPYRLDAYLSQLSRGDWIGEAIDSISSNSGVNVGLQTQPTLRLPLTLEALWRFNTSQLSPATLECLECMAVCGRQLLREELVDCLGRPNDVESLLEELSERRLILRDDVDGQMLRLWHDRLMQQVTQSIPQERLEHWHRRWAEHLATQPHISPAEVADHYGRAGLDDRFLEWAERAAEHAQNLYAHVESARWQQAVAERVSGPKRHEALRLAAEFYQRGGRLYEAAKVYSELAKSCDGEERLSAELDQVDCLLRSGHLTEMRNQLPLLLMRLQLPIARSRWAMKWSLLWRSLRWCLSRDDLSDFRRFETPTRSAMVGQQIVVCRRLVRPLSVVDNLHSAELSLVCGHLVRRYGRMRDRIETGVGEAVFRAYSSGKSRRCARQMLIRMHSQLSDGDEPSIGGDIHSAQAWIAVMESQWHETLIHVDAARQFYAMSAEHKGFELGHLSYPQWLALFQTGRIESLIHGVEDLVSEGASGNDHFLLVMGTFGYAAAGHLASDFIDGLQSTHQRLAEQLGPDGLDAFAFLEQVKESLLTLYRHDVTQAVNVIHRLRTSGKTSGLLRVQAIRIWMLDLIGTMALQLLTDAPATGMPILRQAIAQLRRERDDYATLKANFFEAIGWFRYGRTWGGRVGTRQQAFIVLQEVIAQAQAHQCVPIQLAAEDQLLFLQSDRFGTRLIDHLASQNVTDPQRFARLYRGD